MIYDFRSDDLMNGGEGAPLAPMHNFHLAASLREKGVFPVAFCNGGNTGNIALISQNGAGKDILLGWDVGPFNHFADTITRTCFGAPYDKDGRYGKKVVSKPICWINSLTKLPSAKPAKIFICPVRPNRQTRHGTVCRISAVIRRKMCCGRLNI